MSLKKHSPIHSAFTLIELLIVIAIIALMMAISIFGLSGARENSRDQRRKSDIESLRTALELYRADCDRYPANGEIVAGTQLEGTLSSGSKCLNSYVYMKEVPTDPLAGASYQYNQTGGGSGYDLCSTLERPPAGAVAQSCGSTVCGTGRTCYYKASNP